MTEPFPSYRVEAVFSGPVPSRQVARASGVSEVEARGATLRCRVHGSFQPFLEALRGFEVLRLESGVSLDVISNSRLEESSDGTV